MSKADLKVKRKEKKGLKKGFRERLSTILIVTGIAVIAFPFLTEIYGYFKSVQLAQAWEQQAKDQRNRAERIRENQKMLISSGQLPNEDAIISDSVPIQSKNSGKKSKEYKPFPKTRIIIPKINVDQVILEGTSPDVLQLGPGHYIGMANPGEKGNVGIAGHRVTYTHPFNRLDELSEGDVVMLETVDYKYEYRVESMEVTDPKDIKNLQPSDDPRITLTTCNPKYSAKTRLNVMGVLVNSEPRRVNIVRVVQNIFKEDESGKKKERPKTYEEQAKEYDRLKKVIADNPMDAESYVDLAWVCLALERYHECLEMLKKSDLLEPNSPEAYNIRADFEAKKAARIKEVAANGDISGKGGNIDPTPYFDLGSIYMATGEYDKAVAAFRGGIEAYPHAADPYVFEAIALEKLGRSEEAIAAYNKALVYDPTYEEALNGIDRIKNKEPVKESAFDIDRLHYRFRPH